MSDRRDVDPLADALREAYRQPSACPPAEAYHRAVIGDLPPAERERLDEHARACPACAAERDLAARFEAPVPAVVRAEVDAIVERLERARPAPAGGRVIEWPAVRRWTALPAIRWAAAAVLVLAAGVAVETLRSPPPPLPERTAEDVVRSSELDVVGPVGVVDALPGELRWIEIEGAASYRVTLTEVDGTVLWRTAAAGSPAALPDEVIAKMHLRVTYLWRVEALDAEEVRLAWSEPIRFEARPGAGGGS